MPPQRQPRYLERMNLRPSPTFAVAAAGILLVVTGCAPTSTEQITGAPESASPSISATPMPSAMPSPVQELRDDVEYPTIESITCEGMLDPLVVETLTSLNLTAAPKEFTQFNVPLSGPALECPWGHEGDMHSSVYFAWAALTPAEHDAYLESTRSNGYLEEPGDDGVWLSASSGPPGSEVLVSERWVAFAPTRALIDAIVWTR